MHHQIHYHKSSIFYHPSSWPQLFGKGLMPFLEKYPHIPCLINLNEEQGPNIRLVLAAHDHEFNQISEALNQHLTRYLNNNPSPPPTPSTKQYLFKDFPQNSLRYNLFYHIPFLVEYPNRTLKMDEFLSDFWRQFLQLDIPAIEQILNNRLVFSMQLFASCLFCFANDIKHAHDIVTFLLNKFYSAESFLTQDIETKPIEYNGDMTQFLSDTWDSLVSIKNSNDYLHTFKRLFEELATTTKMLQTDNQRSLVLHHTILRLNFDLGFPDKMLISQFYKKSTEFLMKTTSP